MASQDSQPFHWRYNEFDDRNFQIRGRTLFLVVIFFSVILLVMLLFLYARKVCRFRRLPAGGGVSVPPLPVRGLDPAAIDGLPIILHGSSPTKPARTGEIAECCICLSTYQDGDKVKVLPECCHSYHCECVDRWLKTQPSCPLCRSSLRAAEPPDSAVPRTPAELSSS
ncbi:RING-H2 finger protein ATL66 [Malania oleifera]|uniref:RING-H2 finger protein ATL66 n=1 Tax=Malania oleifera TaxID=397392 RepID=UPI0025AEBE0C|nr:RING-H2 finger protein ATL66 [Malania oleifera]